MKSNTLRRTSGLAALALTATLGLAACGGSNDSNASASGDMKSSSSASGMKSDGAMASDAGAQTFGPGCSAVPTSGAGSFDGMATEPVATAASANPLLKTLVKAVGVAGLADTLNSAQGITVFAPTDDAFAKIPAKDLKAVLKDKKTLTTILSHHVVGEQLSPDQLAGTHKTLAGDTITVKGSGEDFTVGEAGATVLCGNIPTANATVYVIDSVLMP